MKPSLTLGAIALAAILAGPALADGVAPNYGKCAPTGEAASIKLATVEADTLIVATVLPNPGWYNGVSPVAVEEGYEYCMAAEIAHRAGLKNLKLMNLAWDQYISGTAKGYDVAIASTTITDPRKQVFDFTRPYFGSNLGVAVKAGAELTAETLRSKRIGVLQGNMGSEWVIKTLKPETQPSLYQSQPDMVTALMAGQVDAIISDTTLVLSATSGTNGAIKVIGQYELNQGYGVITPKGSENSATVDTAVGAMMEDGTLADLSNRYLTPLFGTDPNSIPVWQLP
jgi:polar amino acid transport system substrate-binding protein